MQHETLSNGAWADMPFPKQMANIGSETYRATKWLAKGRKVIAVGELTLREYAGRDGQMRASLDVRANEVEFLTSPNDPPKTARQEPVDDYATLTSEDIPF